MDYKFSERLLLLVADAIDFNLNFRNWREFAYIMDNPKLRHHRELVEEFIKNRRKKQKFYSALNNLKRRGYIQEQVFKDSRGYLVTSKGEFSLLSIKIKNSKKQKFHGGKWLMVFFDIPEKTKSTRELFRKQLCLLGFEQMQKSVWVSQYDTRKEIEDIIKILKISKFVKILKVEKYK